MKINRKLFKTVAFFALFVVVVSSFFVPKSSQNSGSADLGTYVFPEFNTIPVVSTGYLTTIRVIDEGAESVSLSAVTKQEACNINFTQGGSIQGSSGILLNQSGACFSLSGITTAKGFSEITVSSQVVAGASVVVAVKASKISNFHLIPALPTTQTQAVFFSMSLFLVALAVLSLARLKNAKAKALGNSFIAGNLEPERLMVFRC